MSKKAVVAHPPASPGARPPAPAVPVSTTECDTTAISSPAVERFIISATVLADVEAGLTTRERAQRLQRALGVHHYQSNARSRVWADFLFGVLRFSIDEAKLSAPKTLQLMSIASELFEAAGTPSEADGSLPTLSVVYELFSDQMRRSAATRSSENSVSGLSSSEPQQPEQVAASTTSTAVPTPTDEPFSLTEVGRVVDFMASTFFRHLAAYQRVACDRHPRSSVTVVVPLVVETPMPPPPLADAARTQIQALSTLTRMG